MGSRARLGDIVDDYCPHERRVRRTIVAVVGDSIPDVVQPAIPNTNTGNKVPKKRVRATLMSSIFLVASS